MRTGLSELAPRSPAPPRPASLRTRLVGQDARLSRDPASPEPRDRPGVAAEEWELREGLRCRHRPCGGSRSRLQLEISAALARVGGAVIPMRTGERRSRGARLRRARALELESIGRATPPDVDAERLFPIYRKVRRTPNEFPRRWAEIREAPLRRQVPGHSRQD